MDDVILPELPDLRELGNVCQQLYPRGGRYGRHCGPVRGNTQDFVENAQDITQYHFPSH